mmetsp:Transcript_112346/g.177606  ORF Transcript_112346/g.177606 Transcript_112346/m.177606 type:complete len:202 (-) Transcript_112346:105-710(-)
MALRVAFSDYERTVPSLSRGWRTPDPSPTRNAVGLPSCKPSELGWQCSKEDKSRFIFSDREDSARVTLDKPAGSIRSSSESSGSDRQDDWISSLPYLSDELLCTLFPGQFPTSVSAPFAPVVMPMPTFIDSGIAKEVQVAPGTWATSIGSKGHPSQCAAPCKYVGKTRGCKDGAACDRCHLCDWKHARNSRRRGNDGKAAW